MRRAEKLGLAMGSLLATGLLASLAFAWSSMRCGSKLVSVGDPLYEVRAVCGEPDHVESYVEYRTERYRVRSNCQKGKNGQDVCSEVIGERTVEVPIHRLTYDFGRNRFVSYLRFEFQSLVLVESGSYGVKD